MGQTQVQTWFAVGQPCVRPRSDPGLAQVRPAPDSNLTASLNTDLPSYPDQALLVLSMATDYFEKQRCSIVDLNSHLQHPGSRTVWLRQSFFHEEAPYVRHNPDWSCDTKLQGAAELTAVS